MPSEGDYSWSTSSKVYTSPSCSLPAVWLFNCNNRWLLAMERHCFPGFLQLTTALYAIWKMLKDELASSSEMDDYTGGSQVFLWGRNLFWSMFRAFDCCYSWNGSGGIGWFWNFLLGEVSCVLLANQFETFGNLSILQVSYCGSTVFGQTSLKPFSTSSTGDEIVWNHPLPYKLNIVCLYFQRCFNQRKISLVTCSPPDLLS